MLNISGTIRQENIKFWEIKIQTIDSLPEKIRNFLMKIERVIVQKPPKLIKLTPFDGTLSAGGINPNFGLKIYLEVNCRPLDLKHTN